MSQWIVVQFVFLIFSCGDPASRYDGGSSSGAKATTDKNLVFSEFTYDYAKNEAYVDVSFSHSPTESFKVEAKILNSKGYENTDYLILSPSSFEIKKDSWETKQKLTIKLAAEKEVLEKQFESGKLSGYVLKVEHSDKLELAPGHNYSATIEDFISAKFINGLFNAPDLPSLSVNDIEVSDLKDTNAVFTVSLSAISKEIVTVDYKTQDLGVTQATADQDYEHVSGTLTFAPNETSKTVEVQVKADGVSEDAEKVALILENPTNAQLGDSVGTLTIKHSEALPVVSIADLKVKEDVGAFNFNITLSRVYPLDISVKVETSHGSAGVSDYVPVSQTVTIPKGETSSSVPISIIHDNKYEADEDLSVKLSEPVNTYCTKCEAKLEVEHVNQPITQLTDNNKEESSHSIHSGKAVWLGEDASGYNQVHYYDGNDVKKITSSPHHKSSPSLHGSDITYVANDGNDDEIYLSSNGGAGENISNNDINDKAPVMSDTHIKYLSERNDRPYDYEIKSYNKSAKSTKTLTDNGRTEKNLQVSGSTVVYEDVVDGKSQIWLNKADSSEVNGRKKVQLSPDDSFNYTGAKISGDHVVFHRDGTSNNEKIYYYKVNQSPQEAARVLLTGALSKPTISGDKLAWSQYISDAYEVYLCHTNNFTEDCAVKKLQITENTASEGELVISDNLLMWINQGNVHKHVIGTTPARNDILTQVSSSSSVDNKLQVHGKESLWISDSATGGELHIHFSE